MVLTSTIRGEGISSPNIDNQAFKQLPNILAETVSLFDESRDKDLFLISSIAVLSGCFHMIRGYYFEELYSPHFYLFVTAPAGSGKGCIKWSKYFGNEIHRSLSLEYQNEVKKANQEENTSCLPKRKLLFIPGNSSASAFMKTLEANDFSGIIFETEADSLAGALDQDWGNFDDILRKAFHHESTSLLRRKDSELVEIDRPHLSIVLSGTPRQLKKMLPDAENGLFSRFLFYSFKDVSEFKNPFATSKKGNKQKIMIEKGQQIAALNRHIQ